MADIFISYAREDREWVEKLASQLVTEGYTVWWDWDLLVGKRYRETIETELQTAKAAVVVWSQHSIRSDFVRDEAEDAQQRNILLPLLKEIVRPPAGFRQLQTADLSHWTGDGQHVEFRRMMRGVSSLVGRQASGDTGAIHVDPAHPTTHFSETEAAGADIAPPSTPPPDSPVKTAEPAVTAPVMPAPVAAAPVVAPTPAPIAPASPPPPHVAVLTPAATAPPKVNPLVRNIAIGVVAFFALLLIAAQFIPSSTKPPAKPAVTTVATPPAHTPPHAAALPAGGNGSTPTGGTPPANGGGGDDSGGDVGQAGPHHGGTPPAANPSNGGNTDDTGAGSDNGDTGQTH